MNEQNMRTVLHDENFSSSQCDFLLFHFSRKLRMKPDYLIGISKG